MPRLARALACLAAAALLLACGSPVPRRLSGTRRAEAHVTFSPASYSGIEGRVLAEPACARAVPACGMPSRFVEATVEVMATAPARVVGTGRATPTHPFRVRVSPGRYLLRARAAVTGVRCTDVGVNVVAERVSVVTITCEA